MKITEFFKLNKPVISFEFFPPKTDQGMDGLVVELSELKRLNPSFVSMTYGAGGSTREKTVQLVSKIKNEIGLEAAAHLTCVGHSKDEIKSVLSELANEGIENLVALRGDPPRGESTFVAHRDGFRYATELVKFIKKNGDFCLAVAGYPEKHIEAPSMKEDLVHIKEKVEAGGDIIITQLFFNNRDYFSYVKNVKKLGIHKPVVAGIMPIRDYNQILRFTKMCGASIPKPLMAKLEEVKDSPEKVNEIGIEHATQQCKELLSRGVPGIHFYTLNKSRATKEIYSRLKDEKVLTV